MKTFIARCLLLLALYAAAPQQIQYGTSATKNSNVSSSSQISKNIDSIPLPSSSQTPSQGFVTTNSSSYNKKDNVYGLAQCRGDISKTTAPPASKTLPRKSVKSVRTNLTQGSCTTSASYVTAKRFHWEARHGCWSHILQRR
ncbi:hypothetical protein HID58_057785 [Brassica napus]|uniref:Gnk2-homologous domain-containing protein n=1 Tax=Brassica napus TaxID=3708 RepID=A0ABQ7XFL8_BRANA|nr:hypothetical protein HID58_057785 [Brassica napus]